MGHVWLKNKGNVGSHGNKGAAVSRIAFPAELGLRNMPWNSQIFCWEPPPYNGDKNDRTFMVPLATLTSFEAYVKNISSNEFFDHFMVWNRFLSEFNVQKNAYVYVRSTLDIWIYIYTHINIHYMIFLPLVKLINVQKSSNKSTRQLMLLRGCRTSEGGKFTTNDEPLEQKMKRKK